MFLLQIWFIGRTLASQAGKAGSIPVICFLRLQSVDFLHFTAFSDTWMILLFFRCNDYPCKESPAYLQPLTVSRGKGGNIYSVLWIHSHAPGVQRPAEQRTTVQSIGEKMLIVISGECVIIYLTREPKARVHLAAGNCGKKVAPYLTRTRALLFTLYVDNKSYYSA